MREFRRIDGVPDIDNAFDIRALDPGFGLDIHGALPPIVAPPDSLPGGPEGTDSIVLDGPIGTVVNGAIVVAPPAESGLIASDSETAVAAANASEIPLWSVCKIELLIGVSGSGVLIGEDLVLTNAHVVRAGSGDLDGTDIITLTDVRFFWEVGVDKADTPVGQVTEVVMQDDDLDIAVLRVSGVPANAPIATFETATPGSLADPVWTIGYPYKVNTGAPHSQDALARILLGGPDVVGRLRASPGTIQAVSPDLIGHTCSTTQGSSGSGVFGETTGNLLGIHRGAGTFFPENFQMFGRVGRLSQLNKATPAAAIVAALGANNIDVLTNT